MAEWDGFYPYGIKCTGCGAVLGGPRNGAEPYWSYDRPGELYAGCFTGLCTACMHGEAFVVSTDWDGAQHISYAPDCPSWRRDRTVQIAYADCAVCKGQGRVYVSRDFGSGGSYHQYCPTCLARYYAEPHRKQWNDLRATIKLEAYGAQFSKSLCALHGVKKEAKVPFFPWSEAQTAEYDRLRHYWRTEYEFDRAAVEETIALERATLEADHAKA